MTTRSRSALWLILAFVSGAAVGAAILHSLRPDRPSTQSRLGSQQTPDVLLDQVTEILSRCRPERSFSDEDDFGDWLSDYLRHQSPFDIETRPSTPYGIPDILIEYSVAIELKVNPEKPERDRCVGQCLEYAQRWSPLVVLLDTPPSRTAHLDTLLDWAGLQTVPVCRVSSGPID